MDFCLLQALNCDINPELSFFDGPPNVILDKVLGCLLAALIVRIYLLGVLLEHFDPMPLQVLPSLHLIGDLLLLFLAFARRLQTYRLARRRWRNAIQFLGQFLNLLLALPILLLYQSE